MRSRLVALLASLVLSAPALAQTKLLVVLRSGEVRTFELAEVERIEFAGGTQAGLPGGSWDGTRPTFSDPVGAWDWVDGQRLTVRADGRFDLYRGDGTLISQGRWELLESAGRRYRLVHAKGGYVDTVTLSADGWTISGASNTGYRLEGRRRSDASGSGPAQSAAGAALAGNWNWSDGRVHALRSDGTFDVYTANRKTDEGTWSVVDAASRRLAFAYRLTGTTETLVLSGDGLTMDGTNNRGGRVQARRR